MMWENVKKNKFDNTFPTFFHTLSVSDNFSSSLYLGQMLILFPPQRYLVSYQPSCFTSKKLSIFCFAYVQTN